MAMYSKSNVVNSKKGLKWPKWNWYPESKKTGFMSNLLSIRIILWKLSYCNIWQYLVQRILMKRIDVYACQFPVRSCHYCIPPQFCPCEKYIECYLEYKNCADDDGRRTPYTQQIYCCILNLSKSMDMSLSQLPILAQNKYFSNALPVRKRKLN